MPADIKPLFRPEAVRPKVAAFTPPPAAVAGRAKLTAWAKLLDSGKANKRKETELLADFLRDVFVDLLGYVPPPHSPYSLKREALVEVAGKFADAAFGHFGDGKDQFRVVLEGKGPTDPLDLPYKSRRLSAVEQANAYARNLPTDWFLVTNLKEIRLYAKRESDYTYERFETAKVALNDAEFARFVYLLGADRVLAPAGNHLDELLAESVTLGRRVTDRFYGEYRALRQHTFAELQTHNPGVPPLDLLAATQTILDRVLFIAFCEDRKLLPEKIIDRAYEQKQFGRVPIWENFKGLFRAVDGGDDAFNISKYNGGLFKLDPLVDSLVVPDSVCLGFQQLAAYEYGLEPAEADEERLVDVDILGHVFEQSISDLEEMQDEIAGVPPDRRRSVRRETGAFYTPAFVTRYIVRETLGPVLAERFAAYRAAQQAAAAKPQKKLFADPTVFDADELTRPQSLALQQFWLGWVDRLKELRVVDPSCGSGAFLIEAFDQLLEQYHRARGFLELLRGTSPFDPRKTILTHNLFGMDLNGEAVEIARLSCWIKTAELGEELTTLDGNICRGNSVVSDPTVDPLAVDWPARYPDGFDVVVGNPPYVRQELIAAAVKDHLREHYASYSGTADLYVYFYELGLKPGGRIGYIVTNKWLKAGYGENLRRHYGEAAWVEQVVDFGHAKQIFPDADVFPCILVARKPTNDPPPAEARVCVIPRDQLRIDDLSRQIANQGFPVPRARFGAAPWNLEPPAVAALMDKLKANGVPLKEFIGAEPLRGILTGFNEAFLIDTATKDKLVAADPSSSPLFKPYLRGQDIDRWQAEWAGLWMIAMKSSANHQWQWTNGGGGGGNSEAVFKQTYPALFTHLDQYRQQLIARQDQGEHWWELRSCAYWDAFDKPKLIYPEITWRSQWCFDAAKFFINNTVYILPTADLWVLAVMNAPILWYYSWRTAQHGKDEALRFIRDYVQDIPIPKPTDAARFSVEAKVKELIALKGGNAAGLRAMIEWLQTEIGIERISNKLRDLIGLTVEEMVAEIKKLLPKKKGLSATDLQRIKAEHATTVVPLKANAARADQLEREVSDLVNEAFGLTPTEVTLMWDTAPPRMPFKWP